MWAFFELVTGVSWLQHSAQRVTQHSPIHARFAKRESASREGEPGNPVAAPVAVRLA
jgi:hypothetical protein